MATELRQLSEYLTEKFNTVITALNLKIDGPSNNELIAQNYPDFNPYLSTATYTQGDRVMYRFRLFSFIHVTDQQGVAPLDQLGQLNTNWWRELSPNNGHNAEPWKDSVYKPNDIVLFGDKLYRCTENNSHYSSNFPAELTAGKWQILISENNFSDSDKAIVGSFVNVNRIVEVTTQPSDTILSESSDNITFIYDSNVSSYVVVVVSDSLTVGGRCEFIAHQAPFMISSNGVEMNIIDYHNISSNNARRKSLLRLPNNSFGKSGQVYLISSFDSETVLPPPPTTINYLHFNSVNHDCVLIQSEDYNLSKTLFEFGVVVDVDSLVNPITEYLISRGSSNGAPKYRFGLRYNPSTDELQFLLQGTTFLKLSSFKATYSGKKRLSARYDGVNEHILVDDVIVATSNHNIRPLNSTRKFTIGAYNENNTSTPSTAFSSAKYYEIFIDGDVWKLQEGSGFAVTSEIGGKNGVGQTANAGGLTYWDANVWK